MNHFEKGYFHVWVKLLLAAAGWQWVSGSAGEDQGSENQIKGVVIDAPCSIAQTR
ncbi:MAG: hypothetical protein ACLTXH_14420 [Enterobacter hormaechei]